MRQRPKRDVAQEITNLIIATIEAGTLPWRRPWKKTGMGGAPLRAAGVPYTGINRLYLWAVADHYGYGSRYWMTWRQAIELGGQVRKGETAEPSIYFNSTKKTAVDQATGEESSKTIRFMRAYSVFNASQIDGLPPHFYPSPLPEAPPDFDPDVPSREAILTALRAAGSPLSPAELAERMGVEREATMVGFERRLGAMERDGQLLPNRKGVLLLVMVWMSRPMESVWPCCEREFSFDSWVSRYSSCDMPPSGPAASMIWRMVPCSLSRKPLNSWIIAQRPGVT